MSKVNNLIGLDFIPIKKNLLEKCFETQCFTSRDCDAMSADLDGGKYHLSIRNSSE